MGRRRPRSSTTTLEAVNRTYLPAVGLIVLGCSDWARLSQALYRSQAEKPGVRQYVAWRLASAVAGLFAAKQR